MADTDISFGRRRKAVSAVPQAVARAKREPFYKTANPFQKIQTEADARAKAHLAALPAIAIAFHALIGIFRVLQGAARVPMADVVVPVTVAALLAMAGGALALGWAAWRRSSVEAAIALLVWGVADAILNWHMLFVGVMSVCCAIVGVRALLALRKAKWTAMPATAAPKVFTPPKAALPPAAPVSAAAPFFPRQIDRRAVIYIAAAVGLAVVMGPIFHPPAKAISLAGAAGVQCASLLIALLFGLPILLVGKPIVFRNVVAHVVAWLIGTAGWLALYVFVLLGVGVIVGMTFPDLDTAHRRVAIMAGASFAAALAAATLGLGLSKRMPLR